MTSRLHHIVMLCVIVTMLPWWSSLMYAQNTPQPSFECEINIADVYINKGTQFKSNQVNYPIDTIEIYIVSDYALYQHYQGDTSTLLDYIDMLWTRVEAIYAYDSIPLKLSGLKMWTTQDPYDHTSASSSLTSFAEELGLEFPGKLAHLLSGTSENKGGIAFLNGYCDPFKAYGYANVNGNIDTTAYYNWDVHVLAHEIGHNLGSPHTNDCIWGPDHSTALDGCGQVSNNCANANIPSHGGSIMSSCHQYPEGIIMDQGLGYEPSQVMKSFIRSCSDFTGLSCQDPFLINQYGSYNVSPLNLGKGANHQDATHSKWYRYISSSNQLIDISACDQGVDTRLHIYQGDCDSLIIIDQSDDDCISRDGLRYASTVQLEVALGDTILIEWDNRWSEESFIFTISSNTDFCDNGIRDGDEEDIDCGGSTCNPCVNPCTDQLRLSGIIDNTVYYRTIDTLMYDGIISSNANAVFASRSLIEINAGFEVESGGVVEIKIEDCESNTQSLNE